MNNNNISYATFGGGCFWCTEAVFQLLNGVLSVKPGYSDGQTINPTYSEICTGTTGHAEVIQIEFDPELITFENILKLFFETHDPTTLNRQGYDSGTQYRSVVLFHSDEQKNQTLAYIEFLNSKKIFQDPIVTEVKEFEKFYVAEIDHHNYYQINPNQGYCMSVISPKVEKVEKYFTEFLKNS